MIPPVLTDTAAVFVAGGRRYLSRRAAYRRLAARAVRAREAYRCSCEYETGFVCGAHGEAFDAHRERRIARLARWLAWRDTVLERKGCEGCATRS